MTEREPITLHHLYPQLREKKLLVIDITPTTRHLIDEEARAMQKMKVTTSGLTPNLKNNHVSLSQFVHEKSFDIFAISPHPYILKDMKQLIEAGKKVILLTDSYFVDSESNNAIQKWQQSGIPTVSKDSMKDLPQRLMKTMATMVTS